MRNLCIGLLAHVDAGKTTLSEAMLHKTGMIRQKGRVDHQDAFLDTDAMEKERGITIFSKQAILEYADVHMTLLDTPGHVDFSAEMERTLSVLDAAVLVISASDGVQGHTVTLWRLLERYNVPVFFFINKMDQAGTDRQKVLSELQKRFGNACLPFPEGEEGTDEGPSEEKLQAFYEEAAVLDDGLLEKFLEEGTLLPSDIAWLIRERKIFPCYYGSALYETGIENLLCGLSDYAPIPDYPDTFGARVFKIARDDKGNRLTYMKVTGGKLKVKDMLSGRKKAGAEEESESGENPEETWEEKADQIRIYSGARFQAAEEVLPGEVCAVVGLTQAEAGTGLGYEPDAAVPVLSPVLRYKIVLPRGTQAHQMLRKLKELEEEDPELHIVWNAQLSEIEAMLMGEVQIDVLKKIIWARFHTAVEFENGSVVYRETIEAPVEGVGHFEPLRHYAEVHLILAPGERGSGLTFFTACREDVLDRNWQRLILTHLAEKEHLGVLTGSPITDMEITLAAGKAHIKHTEGGDFRQATYRAVRQGLMKARSILLEPYYQFTLEVPSETLGHAMSDITRMQGNFLPPEQDGDMCILKGEAPVEEMRSYASSVQAYTKGRGRLFCSMGSYHPCRNQAEVMANITYDPEADTENPSSSVFCSHGAGVVIPWYEVENYTHIELDWEGREEALPEPDPAYMPLRPQRNVEDVGDEDELRAIFERTYGPLRQKKQEDHKRVYESPAPVAYRPKKKPVLGEYLLVDGYNIIFAWEELREMAKVNLDSAQGKLKDILSDYQGTHPCTLILVFDAYKVAGHREEVQRYHNIYVVYTKEAETADQYIEKTVHQLSRDYQVRVATSDALEQVIILGQGAVRLSARGFLEEIQASQAENRQRYNNGRVSSHNYLLDHASKETLETLNEIVKGAKKE